MSKPELTVRAVKFDSGERTAVLSHGRFGLPVVSASHFLLDYRSAGNTFATQRQVLLALRVGLLFFAERGIDLVKRAASGKEKRKEEERFLSADELLALLDRCRVAAPGGRSSVVTAQYAASRFRTIIEYIRWTSAPVLARISDPALHAAATETLAQLERRAKRLLASADAGDYPIEGDVLGLNDEQRTLLERAITPGDPSNPYAPNLQVRNYAILRVLSDLGLRAGELLGLKCAHVQYSSGETLLMVHRNHDDPVETRSVPAVTKGNARALILPARTLAAVDDWMTDHRSDLSRFPRAATHPYLFVNYRGEPLSDRGLRMIVKKLEERHPSLCSLHPHVFRHTWNDQWNERAEQHGDDPIISVRDQKVAMGWTENSKMPGRYAKRSIRKSTNRKIARMQEGGDDRSPK